MGKAKRFQSVAGIKGKAITCIAAYHNVGKGRGGRHTGGHQLHVLQPGQEALQQQGAHILPGALETMGNFCEMETISIKHILLGPLLLQYTTNS